jgi:hypothetical protein
MKQIEGSARDGLQAPDLPRNNAGVAANDNARPTVLSRENLLAERESLLSQIDCIEPRENIPTGLILIAVLCVAAVSPLLLLAL